MEAKIMKSQRGFTLVEIIAVLIILGILAAVATPKFFDMQVEAEKKALQGAVAELNAQAKLSWAKNKLEGNGPLAADLYAGFSGNDTLGGDFLLTGQAAAAPATGKIKLASGNDAYAIAWHQDAVVAQGPGYFTLDTTTKVAWGE